MGIQPYVCPDTTVTTPVAGGTSLSLLPAVFCVRGPSGSGKTAMVERLVARLQARGLQTAYVKRTHHPLDLPAKGSSRVWAAEPAAMVIHGVDRLQVTLPPGERDGSRLLAQIPEAVDVVLFETHSPEPYPTLLSVRGTPAAGERLLGWFALERVDWYADTFAAQIAMIVPRDRALSRALRASIALHGGGGCAGLVLGARLALAGADALGVVVPDTQKRLVVHVETDRCAADAVQAVTRCRPGRRTLRLLDYGKLAATFFDVRTDTAVRVSARGDLRARVRALAGDGSSGDVQREAYATLAPDELFEVRRVPGLAPDDVPGPSAGWVVCSGCGEEVSSSREVATDCGVYCRPCAAEQVANGAPGGTRR